MAKQLHENSTLLPQEPVHRLLRPLVRFLHIEAASGVVLLCCSLVAVAVANSPAAQVFLGFWETPLGFEIGEFQIRHSLKHWINDGLMAIFFFVIGLEVKRELAIGDLRDIRRATLPVAAAIGGMLLPAGAYLALQYGQPGERGWGIPMATDIAFVVGCMAVLGPRVPSGLRVMLLSLAIVDDIGAILVIALGYTSGLNTSWLVAGFVGIALILLMQRLGVRGFLAYTVLGSLIWLAFHESGVHATIAGVILGLMTPATAYLEQSVGGQLLRQASDTLHGGSWTSLPNRTAQIRQFRRATRETISPLEYLIELLHPWVAFGIMPVFALANAGVVIDTSALFSSVAMAIVLGLLVGKPLGVLLFSWLAVKLGVADLPTGVRWRHVIGGGFLAGIGFTMALFITSLALKEELEQAAKVGVLAGSVLGAMVGMAILATAPKSKVGPTGAIAE